MQRLCLTLTPPVVFSVFVVVLFCLFSNNSIETFPPWAEWCLK